MDLPALINYAHSMEMSDWQAQQLGALLHGDRKNLNMIKAVMMLQSAVGKLSKEAVGTLFEMQFQDKQDIKKSCEDAVMAIALILKIIE